MSLPFQIFQSDNSIMITYEYDNAVLMSLFKDPGPHRSTVGWVSRSPLEGDMLVVVVTGMNDSSWFDRAGNFHSADMKVVERWTPTGPGVMRYEAEITDPTHLHAPVEDWREPLQARRRGCAPAQFQLRRIRRRLMYGALRKHRWTDLRQAHRILNAHAGDAHE